MITAILVCREVLRLMSKSISFQSGQIKPAPLKQIGVDVRISEDKIQNQSLDDASKEWIRPMADCLAAALRNRGAMATYELPLPSNVEAASRESFKDIKLRCISLSVGADFYQDEIGAEHIVPPSVIFRADILYS